MTVAEHIKAVTNKDTLVRLAMSHENSVRWKVTEYFNVVVYEYTFIDGSSIVHRGYL